MSKHYLKTKRMTALFLFSTAIIISAANGDKTLSEKLKASSESGGSISQTAETISKTAKNDSKTIKASSEASGTARKASEINIAHKEGTQPSTSADEQTPSLSIIMVGDILLHSAVAQSGMQNDGTYNFDALFTQTASEIQEADLALVNQEVIIGGTQLGITGYPSFNAPYELGDALINAGFDVILHATNHALDKGKHGILNCLNYWESAHPDTAVLGIHDSKKDQKQIYTCEQDGIKIAILNYTYGTNGIPLPEDMPYAVDLLNEQSIKKDLARARKAADFIIVCPHWGTEFLLEASTEQETWTQFFLENGVDLVIGTHPHVLEPVKQITGEDGHSMLVYYSLGNFVSWTSSVGEGVSNRMVGGMAQIELQKDSDGEVFIADYQLEPLVTHLETGIDGVTTYFLKDYTKKLAAKNEIHAQDPDFSLRYCKKLCKKLGF